MPTQARIETIRRVAAQRQRGLAVVLEDIHDPHNAEAVLRTCDAVGVQDAYFVFEREEYYDPRRIGKQSSGSANKWVDCHIFHSTAACIARLKALRYESVAAVVEGADEWIHASDFTGQRLALWFGNEHAGLSPAAIAAADRRVSIPMRGMVRSLNVSVTAAIFLYEVARQRRANPSAYRLTLDEVEQLCKAFLKR